ncbi:MAG: PAS domain S-box protein, partial [Rhodomicrobium sp.]
QRFRATFENAAVGVAHVAPDGSWLLVNRRLCQILGYTPEEILTKRFQDITHPDHLEADLAQLRNMLDGEINSFSTEKRYLRKDGSAVWARLTVGAVRKGDGNVSYFISVVEDISEKKRADNALRESEERFRGIYEHAATAIAITDMRGRLQSCNPAFTAMLGYSEHELRQLDFRTLIHPEDRDANLQQVRRLISQEIPSFEIVNRYLGKDGKVIWAHKHCSVLRDAYGRASSIIALVTDITARKRYEEQIRESEQQLQLALDAGQLGTWRRDLNQDPNTLLCDARCEALLGLPASLPVRYETFLNTILPEDRAQVKTAVARALDPADPGDDYACEYRIRHSGGTVLWISSMGRAYFEADPASSCGRRAVFMAGTLYDVTERHLAKAARESEERLRHLGDSLPDNAVYRYTDEADGTSRFHYISAGVEQLNGVRVEDVLSDAGVLLGQILPDHLPRLIEAEKRSASEMSDFKMEVPMRRPDGEVRWMRLQSRPHRGKNGTVIWDGVQTDITNQKRAEQALRASEE